jgi:hypothetical protein
MLGFLVADIPPVELNAVRAYSVHSVGCLTTGPWPLPKRVLHRVRSSASSLNFNIPRLLSILSNVPVFVVLRSTETALLSFEVWILTLDFM